MRTVLPALLGLTLAGGALAHTRAPLWYPRVHAVLDGPPRPELREYGADAWDRAAAPDASERVYFLVPFKDKTVQAAVAYWVDGATLHYITVAGARRAVPLSEVDRKAAVELNRRRPVQLRLPPER